MSKGWARAGFDLDLKHGQCREEALGKLLREGTIEVKSDGACRRTGNLFVEYRQNGTPSGIAITTADYWAFEYDTDCWLIVPTERLRAIAREVYLTQPESRLTGGDFNRYEGVAVPISRLVRTIKLL